MLPSERDVELLKERDVELEKLKKDLRNIVQKVCTERRDVMYPAGKWYRATLVGDTSNEFRVMYDGKDYEREAKKYTPVLKTDKSQYYKVTYPRTELMELQSEIKKYLKNDAVKTDLLELFKLITHLLDTSF